MYVIPRPSVRDDPHFGIRLGLVGALSVLAAAWLDPVMPTITAALPVGLVAAQRKAPAPLGIVVAPLAVCVLATVLAWFVTWVHPLAVVQAGAAWLVYFIGFRMILRTGATPGMLLVVFTILFSVIGMSGGGAVAVLRNELYLAALVALVVVPLSYVLVPPRTRARHVATPVPQRGRIATGAAIRATVLSALSFWLYAVMPPSDIMLAIMAALVLVFPTREAVFFEARQRMRATLYGSALALAALAVFPLSPHLPILLGLVFLAGYWVGQKMLHDPRPHMAFQNAYPAALALIVGALAAQDVAAAIASRVGLTLVGAFAAAFAVAWLDRLTGWRDEPAVAADPRPGAA
ncbi:FUSC family protein [Palleronia sediminis]|uniref:FUSC family protein n=2 Tax=Palleronia sediminis TaxID=2547833 RepID=A0A4R6A608_9RHOB|nr:FUSC family protein [Palleronia sediminis]